MKYYEIFPARVHSRLLTKSHDGSIQLICTEAIMALHRGAIYHHLMGLFTILSREWLGRARYECLNVIQIVIEIFRVWWRLSNFLATASYATNRREIFQFNFETSQTLL